MTEIFSPLKAYEVEPLQDHCGIVGIYSVQPAPLLESGYQALLQIQTRGYDGAGALAVFQAGTRMIYKNEGTIREVFDTDLRRSWDSRAVKQVILQTRYGTNGSFDFTNLQPFTGLQSHIEQQFAIVHNGQFSQEINQDPYRSDTHHFAKQIEYSKEDSWPSILTTVLKNKTGAWSLIISTDEGMYLSRDPQGIRPLYYSQLTVNNNTQFLVASETASLKQLGANTFIEVPPGGLVKINDQGVHHLVKPDTTRNLSACSFEGVYLRNQSSQGIKPTVERPTVKDERYYAGQILASEEQVDWSQKENLMVIGIPGTAIPGGQGYADALGLEYSQAIEDQATPEEEQRTFMQAQKEEIYNKVLNHFKFDKDKLKGKEVILVDDSLVRGNISKGIIHLLKKYYGVSKVHFRVLSPPIDDGCHLGVNTRSTEELAWHQFGQSVEGIRLAIGAETLQFLSSQGLAKSMLGVPDYSSLCMGCMNGHSHPIDLHGNPI